MWLLTVVFGLVIVVIVLGVYTVATSNGSAFKGFVTALAFLLLVVVEETRVADHLTVTDGELRWETPVWSGTVPLEDLIRLRPGRVHANSVMVTRGRRRWISVVPRRGLDEFAEALAARVPGFTYRFGLSQQILMFLPIGRSRFRWL